MPFANAADIEKEIIDTLNANVGTWGGAILNARYSAGAITAARRAAAKEVLTAVAANPQHGYFGALATLIEVEHDQVIGGEEGFDGEPGIPRIVPFDGAAAHDGIPADPDEIDAYRNDNPNAAIYTGALDGVAVAHDQPTATGRMSPVACQYSIVHGRLKFTGLEAQVPIIQITDEMLDEKIPLALAPTVTKRAIPRLVKEGDNLFLIAAAYGADGKQDLIQIAGGAMKVPPAHQPSVVTAQKTSI